MQKMKRIALAAIAVLCMAPLTALADDAFKPSNASASQTLFATALVFISGVIFLIVCALLFVRIARPAAEEDVQAWPTLVLVVALALALRVLAATMFEGYSSDIACFKGWAIAAYENGPAGFYDPNMFADYPPGYMGVLWLLGFIRSAFQIDAGGALFTLLIKLPAILAEVGLALLAYRIASRRQDKTFGLLCAAFLLFNPAMFFDSSVWGQIEPVLTLFLALALWFLYEKRYIAAAALYALAVIFKPQAIMFAPVIGLAYLYGAIQWAVKQEKKRNAILLLCGTLVALPPVVLLIVGALSQGGVQLGALTAWSDAVWTAYGSLGMLWRILIGAGLAAVSLTLMGLGAGIRRLAYGLGCVLAAAAVLALFIGPFTGDQSAFWIIKKYTGTIDYYSYASINAFNVYTLLGLNWGAIPTFALFGAEIAWGTAALVFICMGIVVLQWRTRAQRRFFDLAALLVISVFMLVHSMHERYILPACICLVFAYIESRDASTLFFAAAFSIYALLNQMLTLYAPTVTAPETPTVVLSAVGVALYGVYAVLSVRKLWSNKVLIKTPAMQG